MEYKSLTGLSGPAWRIQPYYVENLWWYDIEYICEAEPDTVLSDFAWRVCRVRYISWTQVLIDKVWAINNIAWNERMASYGKWTGEFIFKATDLSYVSWLTFNSA